MVSSNSADSSSTWVTELERLVRAAAQKGDRDLGTAFAFEEISPLEDMHDLADALKAKEQDETTDVVLQLAAALGRGVVPLMTTLSLAAVTVGSVTLYALTLRTLVVLVAHVEGFEHPTILAAAETTGGSVALQEAFLLLAERYGAMMWQPGDITTFIDENVLPRSLVEEAVRRALKADPELLANFQGDDEPHSASIEDIAHGFVTYSLDIGPRALDETVEHFRTSLRPD
jgi:hypothetical protein